MTHNDFWDLYTIGPSGNKRPTYNYKQDFGSKAYKQEYKLIGEKPYTILFFFIITSVARRRRRQTLFFDHKCNFLTVCDDLD